ncbi:MAG: sugar ABC transporter substrate-binding protein [Alphaproteobacteria bacterium]
MTTKTSALSLGAAAAMTATALIASPAVAQDDEITIGFVTHVLGNPFIQQIIDGAQFAADDLGVNLEVQGPAGGSPEEQIALILGFQNTGVDGIATSVPGASLAAPINEIVDAGVPVVMFNLLDAGVNAPYVGERSVESGRILGRAVIELLGGNDATGVVRIGNCFPGFPVLENRAKGVLEALAEAPGLDVNQDAYDVTVDPVTNYAAWEALLTANPDAVALIGLCAPDLASLGQLQDANPDIDFIAGGYDLTAENLAALERGSADVSIGQTPFMQGYLPVKILHDAITGATDIDLTAGGFLDSGTEIVYSDSVTQPFGLPALTFSELQVLAADPEAARAYYQPLVDGVIANWEEHLEPIENEGK